VDRIDNIFVERNGVYNHWGVWVDPELPITGVISNNLIVQFISDEMYDCIDLDYEEHINTPDHILEGENCFCVDMWDCGDSTYLIGDWIKDSDGLWDYDPDGEYAAIVRESTTQVVYSKYTKRAGLCSPCYPGQADNESDGEFLAYDLPSEAYDY